MPQVVIAGYFGAGNYGDEVCLAGILREIRMVRSDAEVVVLSHNPGGTSGRHGVPAIGRAGPAGILSALWSADLVLLGGGGLVQDSTSRRSALYYLGLMWLAEQMDRPCAAISQGFGPLRGRAVRRLARGVFRKASYVSVRDAGSRDDLLALGVPAEQIELTCDAGLRELTRRRDEFLARGRARRPSLARRGRPVAIVVPRRGAAEPCAAAGQAIARSLRAELHFVPLAPEDEADARAAAARGGTAHPFQSDPDGTTELLAAADVVVTKRLHAGVAAAVSGVGAVGWSDDPKLARFFASAGARCLPSDAAPDELAQAAVAAATAAARREGGARVARLASLGGADVAFLDRALNSES